MPSKSDYQSNKVYETVAISSGSGTSTGANLFGMQLVGVVTPATMTSTALRFEASINNGSSYVPIENGAGTNISKTISGGEYIPIDPSDFIGVEFIRLVGGTNEAADRVVTLVLRAV